MSPLGQFVWGRCAKLSVRLDQFVAPLSASEIVTAAQKQVRRCSDALSHIYRLWELSVHSVQLHLIHTQQIRTERLLASPLQTFLNKSIFSKISINQTASKLKFFIFC